MKLSTFIIFIITISGCSTNKLLKKNKFEPIMIDGKIEKQEWSDSKSVTFSDNYKMFIKEDDRFYYIAIESIQKIPFYVDMFVATNSNLYNIHASSQLGQRKLTGNKWDDRNPKTNWGYKSGWVANTVLFDRSKRKKLKEEGFKGNIGLEIVIPYDGFEFQFSKDKWNLNKSSFRIELRNMVGIVDFKEIVFPANSTRHDSSNWFKLFSNTTSK